MEKKLKDAILKESVWLLGFLLLAAILEYSIIAFFDLHPVLSVKIQGFIGLLIIAYFIRMTARLWKSIRHHKYQSDDQIQ